MYVPLKWNTPSENGEKPGDVHGDAESRIKGNGSTRTAALTRDTYAEEPSNNGAIFDYLTQIRRPKQHLRQPAFRLTRQIIAGTLPLARGKLLKRM